MTSCRASRKRSASFNIICLWASHAASLSLAPSSASRRCHLDLVVSLWLINIIKTIFLNKVLNYMIFHFLVFHIFIYVHSSNVYVYYEIENGHKYFKNWHWYLYIWCFTYESIILDISTHCDSTSFYNKTGHSPVPILCLFIVELLFCSSKGITLATRHREILCRMALPQKTARSVSKLVSNTWYTIYVILRNFC